MNRRELLRELSRVQATWVNRNTPGSGDVNVTTEQEQDYLTRISAVIERAREDVRRKRPPILSADAMAATRIIDALLAGFRFDPNQERDPDGKWGDGTPGPSNVGPKADKLKLAGRIKLGSGERLVGSAKIGVEDESEAEMFMAAVDGPSGPELRIGVPAPDYGDVEYDDEGNPVENVAWSGNDPSDTVRLDRAGQERLRTELGQHAETAKARQAEAERNFAEIDRLEKRYHQLYSDANDRRDPDTRAIAPEDRAKIDAVQAELEPLYDWQNSFEPDDSIAEGVIPGVAGYGDLAYHVEGADDGKFGWTFRFAVKPPDAPADWSMYDARTEGATAIMDAADQVRLQKRAASLLSLAGSSVVGAASMAFDPDQPRDREGKWSERPGTGTPSGLAAWRGQEASADLPLGNAEVFRLGTDIAKIMRRDGTTVNDSAAFFDAATEALAGSDVTPRQYIETLDRQYGTDMASRTEAALRERDGATPDIEPMASGPKLPDFSAPYADRIAAMDDSARSGVRASTTLSGGTLADVTRIDWNDRSRTVNKRALKPTGNIDPVTQSDAEELTARVADVLGVRAPAVRRVGPDEVEMEYMPGKTGAEKYGAIAPRSITDAPETAGIGLLDYLTNNADRHTGNWTVDDDGNVYAIDHGLAFQSNIGILAYGPFALAHGFSVGKPKNVTPAELERIRGGLNELRDNFRNSGRSDWFDGMMTRLDSVAARMEA